MRDIANAPIHNPTYDGEETPSDDVSEESNNSSDEKWPVLWLHEWQEWKAIRQYFEHTIVKLTDATHKVNRR